MMSFLLLVLVCVVDINCQNVGISSNFFKKSDLCDHSERLNRECSFPVKTTHNLMKCMALCELDKSCIGASIDGSGMCFSHKECPLISGCTIQNTDHVYKKKYCAHGYFDTLTQQCKCVDGFYGDRCVMCYQKCDDLLAAGYPEGMHYVYLDPNFNGQKPFPIHCKINLDGYFAWLLMNNQGVENFNRSWVDYVNGFYYDSKNFWTGLYAWHRISNAGCRLFYLVFYVESQAGERRDFRLHYDTIISDETSGYSFTFGSTYREGNLGGVYVGNCWSALKNVPFSTWDNDRDGVVGENCAGRAGSAWWYNGCNNPCNALGFGFQFWDSLNSYQLFSLVEVNLNSLKNEQGGFEIYARC